MWYRPLYIVGLACRSVGRIDAVSVPLAAVVASLEATTMPSQQTQTAVCQRRHAGETACQTPLSVH